MLPKRMRGTTAASAASVPRHSRLSPTLSGVFGMKWSVRHAASQPVASACRVRLWTPSQVMLPSPMKSANCMRNLRLVTTPAALQRIHLPRDRIGRRRVHGDPATLPHAAVVEIPLARAFLVVALELFLGIAAVDFQPLAAVVGTTPDEPERGENDQEREEGPHPGPIVPRCTLRKEP